MRNSLRWMVLPLALLLTVSAQAQDQDRGEGRPGNERRRARLIAEFDEDGDGRLSDDEASEARAAVQRAAPRPDGRRDARRDVEQARGRRGGGPGRSGRPGGPPPAMRGRGPAAQGGPAGNRPSGPSAERLLARFDADGDRELDLPELRRLVAQLQRLRPNGQVGPGTRGGPPRGRSFGPSGGRSGFGPGFGPDGPSAGFGGPRGPRRDGGPPLRRGGERRPDQPSEDRDDE